MRRPEGGHVNLSPKGGDTFRVLGPNRACYLDLTGSGNETAAHLLQNGRMTVMFCSFTRMAQILRLFGTGRGGRQSGCGRSRELLALFPDYPGVRQIVVIDIAEVETSCGYQVPLMDYVAERDTLSKWAQGKGAGWARQLPRRKEHDIYRRTADRSCRVAISGDGTDTEMGGAPAQIPRHPVFGGFASAKLCSTDVFINCDLAFVNA